MAITFTGIGANANTSGSTLTITTAWSAGVTLCVVVTEQSGGTLTGSGTVTDSNGRTYVKRIAQLYNSSKACAYVFTCDNASAGTSVTVTYNKVGTSKCAMSIVRVDGAAAASDDKWAVATGSSTSPSVTSPAPSQANEGFVGFISWIGNGNTDTFSQDTSLAWSDPPTPFHTTSGTNDAIVNGGSVVNTGSGALTYAPTISTSRPWAAAIICFKPSVVSAALTGLGLAGSKAQSQGGLVLPARATTSARLGLQNGFSLPSRVLAQAKLRSDRTAKTAILGLARINVEARAPGGRLVVGQGRVSIAARAPGGVVTPGRIATTRRLLAPGGVNIPSAIRARAQARAPGGMTLAARLGARAWALLLPGFGLRGFVGARVHAMAPGCAGLVGRITAFFRAIGDLVAPRPGAGKRRDFPRYIPQPPYEVKRAKPFQPIWDRVRQQAAEEEQRRREEAARAPAPLPPPELFNTLTLRRVAPPDFAQFAPKDPLGLVQRVADARDLTDMSDAAETLNDVADAIEVLKALGLVE